jgi:hypothetical protein
MLPTLFIKSWSFWVFVQILGFQCQPMWNQAGTKKDMRSDDDSRDATSHLVQIVDDPKGR